MFKESEFPVNPWIVTVVISLATFMEVLDTSIANVSLTHIAGGLAAGLDESTWVLTTYLVANAIMMPISGWLSTVFGTKRFYMTCVAIFTVSSLLCGMAPSLTWLIIFRLLQGVGGAGMAPVVQAMLADLFPPEKRGLAFSIYGLSVVFAPAIGPTLGGWITDNYSWRWIFLINVPIGLVSLILSAILVREPKSSEQERARLIKEGGGVDWQGFMLSVVGIGCLEFVLDRGERLDWFESNMILWMAVIAAVSLAALYLWETRQKNPIVDIPLLKMPVFAASFLTMFAMGFILFGTTALLPQFLERLIGYTAERSGMALTAGGIFLMFMMPLVGAVLIPRFSLKSLVVTGLSIMAMSLWWMSQFDLQITFEQAVMSRIFQVSGIALIFAPITQAAYAGLPPGKNNNAAALINLARNLGGSFGIAISNAFISQRSQLHQSRIIENVSNYDAETVGALANLKTLGMSPDQGLGYIYNEVVRQAAMMSYIDVFRVMALLTVLVIPLAFLLKKPTARKPSDEPAPAH
ncbi:DHA2 family efflux MFS transporter permease subunit [soil metagenome]